MAAQFDIEVQRNADYRREYAIVDDDGAPLDLGSATFELSVKYGAGDDDPPIASATVTVIDEPGGIVEVHLSGDQFDAVPGIKDIVRLAYDFIGRQDGDDIVLSRGVLILAPGVS